MKTRLAALLVMVGLVISLAGCMGTATPTRLVATATPVIVATSTPIVVATQVQAPATATLATVATTTPVATVTQAQAAASATATAVPLTLTPTTVPPTATPSPSATVTATVAPPTATSTLPTATATSVLPTATATSAPRVAPTPTIATSSASLTINGQGVAYSYPNGWRLKQETKDRYTVLTLEGPDGALLTLTIYGVDSEPSLLAKSLLDTMTKQFSGATATPLVGTVGGLGAEGYTMKFTYMGVPMTSTILAFRGGKASLTLYTQAADEDLSAVQPGFDVVKNTLVVK